MYIIYESLIIFEKTGSWTQTNYIVVAAPQGKPWPWQNAAYAIGPVAPIVESSPVAGAALRSDFFFKLFFLLVVVWRNVVMVPAAGPMHWAVGWHMSAVQLVAAQPGRAVAPVADGGGGAAANVLLTMTIKKATTVEVNFILLLMTG